MKDLITQARDSAQVRRRDVRAVRSKNGKVGLRYVAPNGKCFFIEPNGYPAGDPNIYSKWPIEQRLRSGHSTHYYGSGYVCVGKNLRRFELYEIFYLIDAWCRGFEKYLQGKRFPARPSESFGFARGRNRPRSLWEQLFG